MYREKIDAFFEENRDAMVRDICRLIDHASVAGEEKPGMPFGESAAQALEEAARIARELGLSVRSFDNYAIDADMNDLEPELGILAHVDVVEAREGWTFPPFEATVKDGRIYGRGAIDDKGPAVAALYALKAAKSIEPALKKGARMIIGSAEETGSADMEYYMSKVKMPPQVFSPDAEYPLINIEKGRYAPIFGASWQKSNEYPAVVSFVGGNTANVIPQRAEALVRGMDEKTARQCCESVSVSGVSFDVQRSGEDVLITAVGKGGHASKPEEAENAQTALLSLLSSLPLAECESTDAIRALAELFPHGDTCGKAMGIAEEDELSGALTLAFDCLKMNEEGFTAQFDSRTPLCTDEDEISEAVDKKLAEKGMRVIGNGKMTPPHHTDENSPLVKTLLSVYEEYTGTEGKCLAIGGGTYVHDIEGGVAFGAEFPGSDGHMHGADEFAVIEELVLSAKMFTAAILKICG